MSGDAATLSILTPGGRRNDFNSAGDMANGSAADTETASNNAEIVTHA